MKKGTKEYIDAINAERDRANMAWRYAIGGTSAAMFFGILSAVKVYAENNSKLLALHNDLIRKGERDRAETTSQMATKAEVEPLKAFVEGERRTNANSGQTRTWVIAAVAIVASVVASLFSKLM